MESSGCTGHLEDAGAIEADCTGEDFDGGVMFGVVGDIWTGERVEWRVVCGMFPRFGETEDVLVEGFVCDFVG